MPYRWIEHTGELEVELEAGSEEGVFEAAFDAMRELLGEDAAAGGPAGREGTKRRVSLSAPDRGALLADWVGELAYLGERDGFVPERLERLELGPAGLTAALSGHMASPPHLVKAATYHGLRFEPSAEGWRARVVLDV